VGLTVELDGMPSHALVDDGLRILRHMDHRGARGAEEKTGDGTGILIQKPHEFLREEVRVLGGFDSYGIGQAFFPADANEQSTLRQLIEKTAAGEGLRVVAWREVPTDNSDLGKTALESEPVVHQFFVDSPAPLNLERLDAKLYVLRRQIEKAAQARNSDRFYICSLDRRKVVYKGLLTSRQLRSYYPDLSDKRVKSSLALVHARFSTNTLGTWDLAHPYRCLVHNGEINTLRGNLNNMIKRERDLASERFGADIEKVKPVTSEGLSDSAVLDNVLDLLIAAGIELPKALRMLIPEAWDKDPFMPEHIKAFYDYFSTIVEPWDGPALVVATDGDQVAAVLDRNGLRPCRYCVTKDGKLIMASEAGVLDTLARDMVLTGRLKPGQLFLVDTIERRVVPEHEIFAGLTADHYMTWLVANRVKLKEVMGDSDGASRADLVAVDVGRVQRAFGYTSEELRVMVQPMAVDGKDPLGSMGNDTPPAILSARNKPLFNYFSQLFAQVSNPPIDYLREAIVTSLRTHVGRERNLLDETPEHCRRLLLESPILTDRELAAIAELSCNGIRTKLIDITYPRGLSLATAIERVRRCGVEAIEQGYEILVLTDRDIGPERVPIPSLLAVSALHRYLIRVGLRTHAGIVLDSGEPRLVHHCCALIGYGADAIHPWLAYQSITRLIAEGLIEEEVGIAHKRYRAALENGLLKVMSKMGISTVDSYKGAQVFQTVGLDFDFVEEYFERTPAFIPGIGLAQLEREVLENHESAFGETNVGTISLDQGGDMYWRRDGELHQWNPHTIGTLQYACMRDDYQAYKDFARYINDQDERLQTFRGLLEFNLDESRSVPLEEVESWQEIVRRLSTGSMSFGALSREAHEALAIAMNRLNAKSGTGEGGEQAERFGTDRECSMKQVASGRFGVTIDYLVHAKQIEIKMAQGSKPGEGGELPGGKVDEHIAAVRFTEPGVGLISPPPHHDIYSIEDLAQLIHDLRCSNPEAEIHVKLVTLGGVGTIAAGVAKARADAVLISGDSGGTGASLKTSIKSAGSQWELGLAETQQVLLANNLRSRITVRVDGGLKTGRDVVVAALLGAEEYGFGTAPLVALGCIMLRKCHCNTCSVGIATQDPRLRKKFFGKPEYVANYFRFIVEEVRELMAALGYRTMDEMIGQVHRLRQKNVAHPKGTRPDLSQLLYRQPSDDAPSRTHKQLHGLDKQVDTALIEKARPAIEQGRPVTIEVSLTNRDRAVGTMLSSFVTKALGDCALPHDTIRIVCRGSAGQSLGAFLAKGISLYLDGEANDHVGKGLSGGHIIVRTPADAGFVAGENIIIGNVALYGATRGEAYFNGMAGERFAVRNSGVMAVVEGVGDHACEYMTGGVVVILGDTGKNFGAGMSGGEAFVYDEVGDFVRRLNLDMVHIEELRHSRDEEMVKRLLENHYAYTESAKAKAVLVDWEENKHKFAKVQPNAFAEVMDRRLKEGKEARYPLPPRPPNAATAWNSSTSPVRHEA
jgi:glutamate synthase domain-containing protein 2/glutamate synthase domain-containing protein 1/glutamate synthase domain-containing protein 3